jgi:predicted DNA-binding ribbon-helix-helix protein
MPATYIPQIVNLEVNDVRLIRQVAEEQKLGDKGFSAALRLIIRDWHSQHELLKSLDPPPKS